MTVTDRQKKMIITGLLLGLLLSALDQTITSTAMPTIISKLGGLSLYSWVFSIYMLTGTASIPLFGKLADLYGRRIVYLAGMGLFVGGSALCGFSTSMIQLIIFRGIQGLGSGALMPLAMIIIGDLYPPHKRGKMQGLVGAAFGIASVAGPAIGGFITEYFNWHWVFFVNLPLGIAAAVLLSMALKDNKGEKVVTVDWAGASVLVASVVSILMVTVFAGNPHTPGKYGWSSPLVLGLIAGGLALAALFIFIESRSREPVMPLFLFRNRTIAVSCISGFFMGMGMFGAITFIPLFVQVVIGVPPSVAGYITTPMMLAVVTSSLLGGFLLTRFRYKPLMLISLGIMALGFIFLSRMTVATKTPEVILYMIITGLGMGVMMPLLTLAVQNAVGFRHRGIATSAITFFRSIGGTLGVSIMGAVMNSRLSQGLAELSQSLGPAGQKLGQMQNVQALARPEVRDQIPAPLLAKLLGVLAHSINEVFIAALVFIGVAFVAGIFMGQGQLKPGKEDEAPENPVEETWQAE